MEFKKKIIGCWALFKVVILMKKQDVGSVQMKTMRP